MKWLASRDVLNQDVRYALRSLTATPAFTLLVVATLALGIGANSAIFSLVDRLFFRSPPGVGDPSGLARIYHRVTGPSPRLPSWMHYPGFHGIVTHVPPDVEATAYTGHHTSIGRGASPPLAHVAWVAPRYFAVLRVRGPALGRYPTDAEAAVDQATALVVISHAQWMARHGGDPAVIGSTIELARKPYTIIGVAPHGFAGVDVDAVDFWATMGSYRSGPWYRQTFDGVRVLIRTGGRTPDQIGEIVTAGYRAGAPRETTAVMFPAPLSEARGPMAWSTEVTIATRLAGVAVVVLLIAGANVTNLLLARTMQRRGEIAIRLALGISRGRLLRLFLVESIVLSLVAAVAALVVAEWGGAAMRHLLMPDITWAGATVDVRGLVFTCGLAIIIALLTALPSALRASRTGLTPVLKAGVRDGGIRRSWGRSVLLVTQVALSLALLVGAGAFARSLLIVQSIRTGYDTDRLLHVELRYDDGKYARDRTAQLLQQVLPDLRAHAGVEDAALTGMDPLSGSVANLLFRKDGSEILPQYGHSFRTVSPRFFPTAGLTLLRGREFGPEDRAGTPPVMVVNEAMARTLWPGEDAIGQCLRIARATEPCVSVIGVAENAHRDGLIEKTDGPAPMYFVPHAQSRGEFGSPTLAIVRAADRRTTKPLADVLRLLALVVASVGTYSALAYSVSRRTREMGIRLALGAPPLKLLRLVVAEGLVPVIVGIGVGVVLALASGRAIAALLYQTSPSDPLVLAVAMLALAATATAGCLVPAWRAMRVDPMTVLRSE